VPCDLTNLCRAELTPGETSEHLARRKRIYLERHPETARGGDRKSDAIKTTNCRLDSFASNTADKTGMNKRTIERAVRRGEKIAPDVLRDVVGTALDKGTALDALAKMEPEQQREVVEDVAASECVAGDHVFYAENN
jgi:hypothetical protein